MKKSLLLFSVIFCLIQTRAFSQIVINEVSTANGSTILDEDGDANDWVELYSANSVNLGDYSLSDKLSDLSKWSLPNITFGNTNNHYLLIMLSGKNRGPGVYYHTNFGLSSGEKIILYNHVASIIADSLTPPSLQLNHSIGRNPDGPSGIWNYFGIPTPHASNSGSTAYSGYEPEPLFSIPGGFYNPSATIVLSLPATASASAVIRYTLDGAVPTTSSTLYAGPITISNGNGGTKVLSARCFNSVNAKLPSVNERNTYLINELGNGIGNLPVISIRTENSNLFGGSGIYDNYYQNWEKPASFEFFDKNRIKQVDVDCGLSINGNGSRVWPQKSFRLNFKSEFGASSVDYTFFSGKSFINTFSGGLNLKVGVGPYTKVEDPLAQIIMKNTHVDYAEYQPVIVFLNGEYWGEYQLREREDAKYLSENHGIDPDKVDLLTYILYHPLKAESGTTTEYYNMFNYIANNNAGSNSFYDQVNKMLDLDNYIDYCAGEIFYDNIDWIGEPTFTNSANNTHLWRPQTADGKWRYILTDMDATMCTTNFGWPASWNLLHDALNSYTEPSHMFAKLMQNTKLKNYFVDRSADLMNTIFQNSNIQPIVNSLRDSLLPVMDRHYTKFNFTGASSTEVPYCLNSTDFSNVLALNAPWITDRLMYARQYMNSEFSLSGQVTITLNANPVGAGKIQISTIVPELTPTWTGVYFNGVPVTITAIPNPGYSFVNWNANAFISNVTNSSFTSNITSNQSFTANFTGSTITPQLTISEINYNSDPTLDAGYWFELHNYDATHAVYVGGWVLKDGRENDYFNIPATTVIPANGYIVFCKDTVKFKLQHPGITNFIGELNYGFGLNSKQIRLFDNSNVLIASVKYDNSNPWPKGADGVGRTLELIDPTISLDLASNWFDGCMGGSPGTMYTPCNDQIVISEINYKSSSVSDAGDWIELHNTTTSAINLSGWRFRNGSDNSVFSILTNTFLPANGYLVLVNDSTLFSSIHTTITNFSGKFSFGLSSKGDELRLYNNSSAFNNTGILQFSVVYDNKVPWPTAADGGGKTLELLSETGHMDDGVNWFAGCPNGSPGMSYHANCSTGISEIIEEDNYISVYPNPFTSQTTITFIEEQKNSTIKIMDVLGKVVKTINFSGKQFVIEKAELEKGIYFVHIINANKIVSDQKIIVQ